MLSYIASDSQVQMAFLLVFAICFVAFLINHRIGKAQSDKMAEVREERRARLMMIEKPKAQVIEG